jgi:hypothetical protein
MTPLPPRGCVNLADGLIQFRENMLWREKAQFDDHTRLPHSIELTDFSQYEHLFTIQAAECPLMA